MIVFHKKNTRLDLAFPILDGTTPRLFVSGASPTFVAYYQDGTGSWTLHTIADTISEIASTGVYELTLTAAELNHDKVLLKYSSGGVNVDAMVLLNLSPNFANFTLGPSSIGLDVGNFIGDPVQLGIFKVEDKTFTLTILDDDGNNVDMSGKTLRFTVETFADPPTELFTVTGGSITISGDDNEIVNVNVTAADSDKNAGKYQWRLWETTAEKVWAHGTFEIVDTSESVT